ncbi:MAG: O-antigen ligase domain-containing protein [Pseudomonadota bacterium]
MWFAVSLAASTATLAGVLWTWARIPDLATRVLLLAVWLRYVLSAFHEITFDPLVAGFSINALASAGVALVGLALVEPRLLALKRLWSFWLLLGVICVSALLNGTVGGLINAGVKWAYFLAILLLTYRAIRLYGRDAVLRALLIAMLTPLVLQACSIVFGVSKIADTDGARSFIGGYHHEAAFSVMLFSFLCVGALVGRQSAWRLTAVVGAAILGILLANYRTTIIAALPVVLAVLALGAARFAPRGSAGPLAITGGLLLAVLAVSFADRMPERFADVVRVVQAAPDLVKNPLFFTEAERDLFTGRIYWWARYLGAWNAGDALVTLIGFGPDAWEDRMALYAHNTLVSYTYEFGLLGLLALLTFMGAMLVTSLAVEDSQVRYRLLAMHVGFFVLNQATMPLWQIEGVILYAILCAAGLAAVSERRIARGYAAIPA